MGEQSVPKCFPGTGNGSSEADTVIAKESLRESLWPDVSEQMFVAAGITAKDKRIKDAMNIHSFLKEKYSPYSNKGNSSTSGKSVCFPQFVLRLIFKKNFLKVLVRAHNVVKKQKNQTIR